MNKDLPSVVKKLKSSDLQQLLQPDFSQELADHLLRTLCASESCRTCLLPITITSIHAIIYE